MEKDEIGLREVVNRVKRNVHFKLKISKFKVTCLFSVCIEGGHDLPDVSVYQLQEAF